jgi:acid phosphatase
MRFLSLLLVPAALAQSPGQYDNLNATLWQQTSGEYRGLGFQAWVAARASLDRALKDKSWTAAIEQTGKFSKLPPAVIVDIDETIVDNAGGQARLILEGSGRFDPRIWRAWTGSPGGRAIAGALEFARYAQSRKVTILYVTNRVAEEEADTRNLLARLGFPVVDTRHPEIGDSLTTVGERPEWTSDKSARRALLARFYRILLLAGDDLNDFLPGARSGLAERRQRVAPYESWWGRRWILLPNPGYGSWENALWDARPGVSGDEAHDLKVKALRPD